MKIYRDRWWQDRDRVTALIALGACGLLWCVTLVIGLLTIYWSFQRPPQRERTPEQVLPAPWEGEEELRARSEEQRV